MNDLLNVIIIILFVLVILAILFHPTRDDYSMYEDKSTKVEGMANLNFGTFSNNYPPGRCTNKSLERTDCMVGNCNLDSPITHDQLCYIDCAQMSDAGDRQRCMAECMELLKYC